MDENELLQQALLFSAAESIPAGPPPASKLAINELVEDYDILEKHKGSTCSVCLVEFEVGENVKRMECRHLFHDDCILKWLNEHNSCPSCRHELPTSDPYYEEQKRREAEARRADDSGDDGEYKSLSSTMYI